MSNPDTIDFLLGVDMRTVFDGVINHHTDWRMNDGSPFTARERELLGQATADDVRAAAAILRNDIDLDMRSLAPDRSSTDVT